MYRARDTSLKREVAIETLPDEFSRDPDRLARFQREAEALAALNHPNLGGMYHLQESHGSNRKLSQDLSVTKAKVVFNQGEITGNIWMTDLRHD